MARYEIRIGKAARKQLAELPAREAARLGAVIDALASEPRPPASELMKGSFVGHYRIRVGAYRIVYTIEHQALLVEVVRVGHRREVYR